MLLGLENRKKDEDDRWKDKIDIYGQTGQKLDKHDIDKKDSLCCTVKAYTHLILSFIPLIHKTKPFTLRYCWCCNSTRSFTMAIWERVQEMKSLYLKTKYT